MQGDFSRDRFDPLRHYSRVLQQQGRVELDADGNERQAIQLHLLRSLAHDLIGPHGGPELGGFELMPAPGSVAAPNFLIGRGHYYVDGWLCENDADVLYQPDSKGVAQPWLPAPAELLPDERYLAYLDVWERHLCASEADDPAQPSSPAQLREVALGGADTTTRAQVVWQVKIATAPEGHPLPDGELTPAEWATWRAQHWPFWQAQWQPDWRGSMAARATDPTAADTGSPCVVSPQARYRGLENQLYRVEVHRGGQLGNLREPPTFKWSRENGSVVFAIRRIDAGSVTLAEGWRDSRLGIATGDVVEIVDPAATLAGQAGPLRRVTGVDTDTLRVSFEGELTGEVLRARGAVLRRWDHGQRKGDNSVRKAGDGRPAIADDLALTLTEFQWLTIEDGISVFFDLAGQSTDPTVPKRTAPYRTGDHWLIPARAALGDVLWPRGGPKGEPLTQPPRGIEHHYAPLGIVSVDAAGKLAVDSRIAARFKTLVALSGGA